MFSQNLMRADMRGFWVGVALTAPFLLNPLPGFLAATPALIPLLVHLAIHRFSIRQLLRFDWLLALIYLNVVLVLAGLLFSGSPFAKDTVTRVIVALGCVGIYLVVPPDRYAQARLIQGFFAALCSAGAIFALAGLVKYWLQLNGFVFESLVGVCSDMYPQGTTFCGDYNIYGYFMAAAAFGFVALLLRTDLVRWQIVVFSFGLAACFVSGVFAGSRRYYFVAALIPTMWLAATIVNKQWKTTVLRASLVFVFSLLLLLPFAINKLEPATAGVQVIELSAPLASRSSAELGLNSDNLKAREVTPEAMSTTMTQDKAYGFDTRQERWKLGWQMIQQDGYLLGRGFSYHKEFSCRFVNCEFIDYPHAPLISHWIAFGLAGFLLALGLFASIAVLIIQAGRTGIETGASFLAISAMPYALISGDTVFSLSPAIVAFLVLLAAREINRDRVKQAIPPVLVPAKEASAA
ncbi:hypothetical protein BJ122_11018 [Rhodopseudomonas faecalis]|uniref:O-antigen ligase-like membrane protein n=1 Tax=Rhodopseudomonas faecalis TaxID=99655 RepID=A0A318TCR4_9BRAD|nr:hypothetical protein [Rhodopseudomonas faecalis]PYF02681.1 hypothetical protein BJ122_11018 [Rhodopseudomonas faecalis]